MHVLAVHMVQKSVYSIGLCCLGSFVAKELRTILPEMLVFFTMISRMSETIVSFSFFFFLAIGVGRWCGSNRGD